ncbi:MAG TPA: S8 family serine peptidase [Vicinamibacterales bacterium]|nr:S8 family serine peptidase [Vicinamibacterales bacterium]
MRHRRLCLTAVLIAALGTSHETTSGQSQGPATAVSITDMEFGDLWFVELTGAPAADGAPLGQVRAEKAAFRRAAAAARIPYQERLAFDTLWNGLSVRIDPDDVARLSRLDGVRAVYPVGTATLPEPEPGVSPQLATALAMTGADIAQTELGLTGAGIKVGVIDSGIDYHHPDLGGCFGPGCRVAYGHDFVGDAFNSSGTGAARIPVPDPDPDDCGGHGTHVAGIVGADGGPSGVTGVAPGATLGAYRVFGCSGTTSFDIVIAALERALADGMDVVNMSLGSALGWPQHPAAQASTRLVNKGVVVVAAAGNDAVLGLYASSVPSVGAKVISVASFQNTHLRLPYFTISPDDTRIGYSSAAAAPAAPTSGSAPMARTGTSASVDDACTALAPGSLAGTVALIRRGACTFHIKALNAQTAGAMAVVLYNNAPAHIGSITVAGTPAITIPVVGISGTFGTLIDSRLASGPVMMTWTDQLDSFPNPLSGLIAASSSYGVSPDLTLKPTIGAPGANIFSTFPLERGGYATLSGTSMASPHVAGAAALLLQASPHTSSQAMGRILQNSADPRPWWGNPGLGFLDNVHRQGAGMLDIDDAILAPTRIEPGELSLGESEGGPATRTLKIANDSTQDVTYNLSHAGALSTGPNTFAPTFHTGFASVAFDSDGAPVMSVAVPSGGTATVNATITANPGLPDRSLYGGYLVFTPQDGGAPYRVPYSGFKGDYQSIQVLAPTPNGFPWLAKLVGTSLVKQADGATFTMQGGDVPRILFHLDHQSRRLRLEVNEAGTGRSWHRVVDLQYLTRNTSPTGFFSIAWDGDTFAGRKTFTVPNGTYEVTLSVLKALGDDSNPAHVETWTSPSFVIARP